MSVPNTAGALISVEEIAESILLKRGMTQHFWWRIIPLVCEAVQELSLTSMPTVRHTQITKLPNETWFRIPNGFMDWVSVGIRIGNRWTPVAVSNRLMPYPNVECAGGEFDNEYDSTKFRRSGDYKSWLNRQCQFGNANFFSDDFFNEDFSDTETTSLQPQPNDPYATYGGNYYGSGAFYPFAYDYAYVASDIGEPVQGRFARYSRPDEVTFNVEKGLIMCPDAFPSDILYLSYVGLGTADTLTYIPIKAQAVIEAYVEWKYAQNESSKKSGMQYANFYLKQYNHQHRLYRARNNDITETDIRRVFDRNYIQSAWSYGNSGGCSIGSSAPTQVIYYSQQSFVVYSGTGGVTFVQSPLITGKSIVYVIVGSTIMTDGYHVEGDMLIFDNGTEFYTATKVIIYYEN